MKALLAATGFAAVVSGFALLPSDSTATVAEADVQETAVVSEACKAAEWPYIPAECLRSSDGSPVASARWVTFEAE